jgi:hypothetical protein
MYFIQTLGVPSVTWPKWLNQLAGPWHMDSYYNRKIILYRLTSCEPFETPPWLKVTPHVDHAKSPLSGSKQFQGRSQAHFKTPKQSFKISKHHINSDILRGCRKLCLSQCLVSRCFLDSPVFPVNYAIKSGNILSRTKTPTIWVCPGGKVSITELIGSSHF